jgi:glycine hydroxymethyltransferase
MPLVVNWLDKVLMDPDNESNIEKVRKEVNEFMLQFALYPEM